MSSIWCRWFGWGCPKPQRPVVGIVCHLFTQTDATALMAMGAKRVRLSWYSDADNGNLDVQLRIAQVAGLAAIVVAQGTMTPSFAQVVGRRATVQVGNEPVDLIGYGPVLRNAILQYGQQLTLYPAGLGNDVTVAQLRDALAAGLGGCGTLCLHAYGTPLVNAVRDRLQMAAAAGWSGPIVLTEIGTQNPTDLLPALQAVPATVPVYVYALYSPDDGYSLTAAERHTITSFTHP